MFFTIIFNRKEKITCTTMHPSSSFNNYQHSADLLWISECILFSCLEIININMLWRKMLEVYSLFRSHLLDTDIQKKISECSLIHLYVLIYPWVKQETIGSVCTHVLCTKDKPYSCCILYRWGMTKSELQSSGLRSTFHSGQLFEAHLMSVTEAVAVIAEKCEEHRSNHGPSCK